ncbi:MAG: DNA primase [Caldilineae bacterium]|nr:MAG: DNA primase [Caldilineae bacterium]
MSFPRFLQMARSVIEEIKERLDIVEVVGRYVPLKKSGTSYKALCPFHTEKTPSFFVFPHTQTWRCFGACGTGGDVINFVQKREGLDFPETLRMLAREAGVDLDRDRDPQLLARQNLLRELNHLAAAYYHNLLLNSPAAAAARAYLQRREINDETVRRFQLGFAPAGWENLLAYLREREYNVEDMEAAGLVVFSDDGRPHDRFYNRLMIPIRDLQGRVIGFGGRTLGDGEPKYLNTAQTAIFDKSSTIFALDLAKRSIRSRDEVVLVEGYMDVLSAHQRGFTNVVAVMGTAVTKQQLRRLSKYTRNFVFALDADAAGANATLRSASVIRDTLTRSQVPVPTPWGKFRYEKRLDAVVKIAAMPPGQDPDDVLRTDPALWQQLIAQATPLVDFYFDMALKEVDLNTAQGKSDLVRKLIPTIHEIDNPVERRHYVGRLANLAGVTEREIDLELESYARALSRTRRREEPPAVPSETVEQSEEPPLWPEEAATEAEAPAATRPTIGPEEHILACLLARPQLILWADGALAELRVEPVSSEDFENSVNRVIFDALQEFLYSDADEIEEHLLEVLGDFTRTYLDELTTYADALQNTDEDQLRKDLINSVLNLRLAHLKQARRNFETELRHCGNDKEQRELLGRQLVDNTRQTKLLEKALSSRSASTQWVSEALRYSFST